MLPPYFSTARRLSNRTAAYFRYIEGQHHLDEQNGKTQKIWDREPEPVTLAGLAHFIGFDSRKQLEEYERSGPFGYVISRCRLRIEAAYERKLHQQSSSGAVFALKNMGWKDKTDDSKDTGINFTNLKVEITHNGPPVAFNEAEVVL